MGSQFGDRTRHVVTRLKTSRLITSGDVPVMIVCRDRLEPLMALLRWLKEEGLTNVYLIDNDSTYPPMVRFLTETEHTVIRLGTNVGHTSPWLPQFAYLRRTAFIVTDCDVVPDQESHGAVERFFELLNRYRSVVKVGFGLHIDDLPECYARREEVVAWESQFWERRLADNVYRATLDTTFALYRPRAPYSLGPALRTGGQYMARHEPWYQDSSALSEDISYFLVRANTSTTWGLAQDDEAYGSQES